MRWLDGITDSMDMSFSKLRELVMDRGAGVLQSMGSQRVRHNWIECLLIHEFFNRYYFCACSLLSPNFSLEELMLKLKLQYFGHLMRRTDSFEKTLMLGKIEGMRRRWQRMRWLDGITYSVDMSWVSSRSWWCTGRPGVLPSTGSQRVRHDWETELTDKGKNG